ncbi:lytic transglycosylase domain-containing protein [Acidiphilium iwatense]|uniref:Lytic transglycosylase domain-containing protein n=1 Tax=Acidiphilium iwatense TaxID=768198 RepID=A0ABS9E2J7_9PROT|nr:lytic transglycosylase domain-containing protein [Acidiphilium iwatense]MCF3948265.1 lytic transglycosylase domain-containing protein [Acidiphilium iwatense]
MILAVALAGRLAARCASEVAPGTLVSIAGTESGFNTLAIHDNTAGRNYVPASRVVAIGLARALIAAGQSIDLGLMQVNSGNLNRLGLTVRTAFNACASLGAAGRLLVLDYRPAGRSGEQSALQAAFSRYNTGNGVHGFQNGYVERVVATARRVVPEINPAAPVAAPKSGARPSAPKWNAFGHHATGTTHPAQSAPAAPFWNVFPRSVGPARLAQHRAVIVTAHRLDVAGSSHPQDRTVHDKKTD